MVLALQRGDFDRFQFAVHPVQILLYPVHGESLDQIQTTRDDHLDVAAVFLQAEDLLGVHVREVDRTARHFRGGRHHILDLDRQSFQRGGVQVADEDRFSIRDDQIGQIGVVRLTVVVVLQRVARMTLALVGALRVDADLRAQVVFGALVDIHALRLLLLVDTLSLRTGADRSQWRSLTLVVAVHRFTVDQVAGRTFVCLVRTIVFAVAHLVQVYADAGDVRTAPLVVNLAGRHQLFAGMKLAVLIFAMLTVRITIAN